MKIVVQRVNYAKIAINGEFKGEIGMGILALIGITHTDHFKEADFLIDKLLNLRIFEDEEEKMNLSLKDVKGEILLVSQFTLYGDASKGRRPSYIKAARPEHAEPLYDYFVEKFTEQYPKVLTGEFASDMKIDLCNDGPVTIILEKE